MQERPTVPHRVQASRLRPQPEHPSPQRRRSDKKSFSYADSTSSLATNNISAMLWLAGVIKGAWA